MIIEEVVSPVDHKNCDACWREETEFPLQREAVSANKFKRGNESTKTRIVSEASEQEVEFSVTVTAYCPGRLIVIDESTDALLHEKL